MIHAVHRQYSDETREGIVLK